MTTYVADGPVGTMRVWNRDNTWQAEWGFPDAAGLRGDWFPTAQQAKAACRERWLWFSAIRQSCQQCPKRIQWVGEENTV